MPIDLSEYGWEVSPWVEDKLKARGIEVFEVEEAIQNSTPPYLLDKRAKHSTIPPTRWFIAPTMDERLLKVVFVLYFEEKIAQIKTAYEPDEEEIELYEQN